MSDTVVGVSDLLIHLASEQMEKKGTKVVEGEALDILVGSMPQEKEQCDKEAKDAVKKNILAILKDKYGIEEEDFLSAELEAVPAGPARDYGIDRSMIMGYGHDDRVCAYPSLIALINSSEVKRTGVCILVDKEEIGSVGATGMQSRFFENMVAEVCKKVNGTTKVTYQGAEIDFMPPWRRITMVDAVKEYAGVDYNEFKSDADAQAVAKEKNLEFSKPLNTVTKGEVLNALYEEFCEEHMIQPTFIIDYPVEISPLTKKKRGNEMFTERFEGFVFGRELCNAYSELNDPIVQRERFAQQEKERELGDDEAYMIDEEFMSALETGMPPTGGLGIGIDRLIMFLTDSASIRDVILFPTMKPINQ